jgi:Predicted dehydrogenases and related proteins
MLKDGFSRREFLLMSITAGTSVALRSRWNSLVQGAAGANDRVRVGIIGIGRKGRRHLAEYLKLPNVEVAAICDLDESKLRLISKELFQAGVARPFITTNYARLLENREIDLVSVATPKRQRAEIGVAACDAGRHLMMEKPFSASVAEGRKFVKRAKETKRFVQQRESLVFASHSDMSSLVQPVAVGDIDTMRGWKKVTIPFAVSRSWNLRDLRSSEVSHDLTEFALDELDMARCLLDIESPQSVTTAFFGDYRNRVLPIRVALQFDFHKGGSRRKRLSFELDIATSQNSSTSTERFAGRSIYSTARGELSLDYSSDFEELDVENNSWGNLVSAIRADNMAALQNPISEAQKSCELIHLAADSLQVNIRQLCEISARV